MLPQKDKESLGITLCLVLALSVLFSSTTAFGENHHEHLLGIPSYDDIIDSYRAFLEHDRSDRYTRTEDRPVTPDEYDEGDDFVFHNLRARLDYVATLDLMRSQGWLGPNEEYPADGFSSSRELELNALARAYLRTKKNWSEIRSDIMAQNPTHAFPDSLSGLPVAALTREPVTVVETLFGRDAVKAVASEDTATPTGRQAANEHLRKLPIKELCAQLAKLETVGNAARAERSLFEFSPANRRGPDSYRVLESIRSSLYEYLADKLGDTRFDALWRETMWTFRRRMPTWGEPGMAITVPARFFNERMLQATSRGFAWHLHYFLSMPRSVLLKSTDAQFENELGLLRTSIEKGWGHGVDVSGSLQETDDGDQTVEQRLATAREQRQAADKLKEQAAAANRNGNVGLSEQLRFKAEELFRSAEKLKVSASQHSKREAIFKEKLKRLISVGVHAGGEVRLHMFERSRSGPFYDAVRSVLSEISTDKIASTKGRIRIGHISAINDSDIEFYQKLGRRRDLLVFEANQVSNTELGNNDLASLARTIQKLQAAGLAVVIGSDEAGILGRETELASVLRGLSAHGLPEDNLMQLMADNARYFPQNRESDQTFLACVHMMNQLGAKLNMDSVRRHLRQLMKEKKR